MVLLQNWPFFHLFILGNIGQENVFYDIVERKNAFLGYKNKKQEIFGKVLVQNWPFFHFLILSNIDHKNVLYDILKGKNAFLGYKNETFKKLKKGDFSKGVSQRFWSKIGQFSILVF